MTDPAALPPALSAAQKAPSSPSPREAAMMEAARALEASFLAEMLGAAGLGETREAMGGGAGEDAFGSLLVRAQAEEMTRAGGIGLARSIFEALMAREGAAGAEAPEAGAPEGTAPPEAGR